MYGKRILLGITGGIAAYKIAYLIRSLKRQEAEVKCIMPPASFSFISPLVVSTLSKNEVAIEFWDKASGTWNNHVEYAEWADIFIIAPATMNTIGKMANGLCDNLLLATYFSMKGKTIVAPAMDLDMYKHPSFLRNIDTLIHDGVAIIPAEDGELASGLEAASGHTQLLCGLGRVAVATCPWSPSNCGYTSCLAYSFPLRWGGGGRTIVVALKASDTMTTI